MRLVIPGPMLRDHRVPFVSSLHLHHHLLVVSSASGVNRVNFHGLHVDTVAVHEAVLVVRVEVRVGVVFGRDVLPIVGGFGVRVDWTQFGKELVSACWTGAVLNTHARASEHAHARGRRAEGTYAAFDPFGKAE